MTAAGASTRIVLVGFMGAGKSTVGPLLAARLGWSFVDLDQVVADAAGRPVATIFREDGEAAFRQLELDAARRVALLHRHVIATGGGAFAQPETREVLRRDAFTVWLRCDLDAALARTRDDGSRPLRTNRATMHAVLTSRETAYAEADLIVDTTAVTPAAVADAIAVHARARTCGAGGRSEP